MPASSRGPGRYIRYSTTRATVYGYVHPLIAVLAFIALAIPRLRKR